jgi:hypothetical protein
MSTLEKPTLTEPGYDYHVRINWTQKMSEPSRWDDVCIYAIEHYGLPGKNYVTDMSVDRMIWSFKDSKNALMFKLRWSEVAC